MMMMGGGRGGMGGHPAWSGWGQALAAQRPPMQGGAEGQQPPQSFGAGYLQRHMMRPPMQGGEGQRPGGYGAAMGQALQRATMQAAPPPMPGGGGGAPMGGGGILREDDERFSGGYR